MKEGVVLTKAIREFLTKRPGPAPGPDPPFKMAELAAAALMVELAGGQAVAGVQDNYPEVIEPWSVDLPLAEIPRLLGIELERELVIDLLSWIGFESGGEDPVVVTVPYFCGGQLAYHRNLLRTVTCNGTVNLSDMLADAYPSSGLSEPISHRHPVTCYGQQISK